jgi:hypothetical protein
VIADIDDEWCYKGYYAVLGDIEGDRGTASSTEEYLGDAETGQSPMYAQSAVEKGRRGNSAWRSEKQRATKKPSGESSYGSDDDLEFGRTGDFSSKPRFCGGVGRRHTGFEARPAARS